MGNFCSNCGAPLVNGVCPNCSAAQPAAQYQQPAPNYGSNAVSANVGNIFTDPSEKTVGVLGENYLTTGKSQKGFAVISDKRLYVKGNGFKYLNSRLKKSNLNETIDLGNIVLAEKIWIKNISDIVIMLLCAVLTVGGFVGEDGLGLYLEKGKATGAAAANLVSLHSLLGTLPWICIIIFIVQLFSIIFVRCHKYFVITFKGGNSNLYIEKIALPLKWYKSSERNIFLTALQNARSHYHG